MTKLDDRIDATAAYFLMRASESRKLPPIASKVVRVGAFYEVLFTVLLGVFDDELGIWTDAPRLDGGCISVPIGDQPTEEHMEMSYAMGVVATIEDAIEGWLAAGRSFDAECE